MTKLIPSIFQGIEEINTLIKILSVQNFSSKFVGGVVRDIIQYNKFKRFDVDIATTINPEKVVEILEKNNFKPNLAGLKYGSISLNINDYKFDITTLRSEIDFRGRNPKVMFTEDWLVDARRRDFTINAIYLDFNGNIYDPFDGVKDLNEGKIKFIGDPLSRINEDPLRIFRYFRFVGLYSNAAPDRDALIACSKLSGLILTLSKDRVTSEFFKILSTPNPMYVIDIMIEAGVLQEFFPQASRPDRLEFLYNLEISADLDPDIILRLASLIHIPHQGKEIIINKINKIFVFTKKQQQKLDILLETYPNFSDKMTVHEINKMLYRLNSHKKFFDVLLISWVKSGSEADFRKVIETVANLEIPIFPIGRKDMISLYGELEDKWDFFDELESWWLNNGCKKSKDECLLYLKKIIKNK